MPAVELLGPDGRADAHAFVKTDAGAVTCPDARTDARTDDGDARAHTTTVGVAHTCSIAKTNHSSALKQADASALLVGPLLERQEYG